MLNTPVSRGTAIRNSGTADTTVASFTPAADCLLLAIVFIDGLGDAVPDSVTGHGTWTEIDRADTGGGDIHTASLWGCFPGSSPSAATVSSAYATSASMGLGVVEISGDIDTSGSITDAFNEYKEQVTYGAAVSATLVTAPTDLTIGFFCRNGSLTTISQTAGKTATELFNKQFKYNGMNITAEYLTAGATTHSASTESSSRYWVAYNVNIKDSPGGGGGGGTSRQSIKKAVPKSFSTSFKKVFK